MDAKRDARVIGRSTLGAGKFLRLDQIRWLDAHGAERTWESAERIASPIAGLPSPATGLPSAAAVAMIAELSASGRLVLVRQYRPAAGGLVWEFPAGLMDAGETPAQTAQRELLEETGYRGLIAAIFPPAYSSAGMSGEQVYLVHMSIDETAPENQHAVAQPDEGEDIEVRLVKRSELLDFIETEARAGGRFDNKLIAYACGLTGR